MKTLTSDALVVAVILVLALYAAYTGNTANEHTLWILLFVQLCTMEIKDAINNKN